VLIVDGSNSSNLWDSIIPWDELPTTINPDSGFVQQANEPPWTMAEPIGEGSLDPGNYVQYMLAEGDMQPRMGYRPQVGAILPLYLFLFLMLDRRFLSPLTRDPIAPGIMATHGRKQRHRL
jgi:hypothetical protein